MTLLLGGSGWGHSPRYIPLCRFCSGAEHTQSISFPYLTVPCFVGRRSHRDHWDHLHSQPTRIRVGPCSVLSAVRDAHAPATVRCNREPTPRKPSMVPYQVGFPVLCCFLFVSLHLSLALHIRFSISHSQTSFAINARFLCVSKPNFVQQFYHTRYAHLKTSTSHGLHSSGSRRERPVSSTIPASLDLPKDIPLPNIFITQYATHI